MRRAHSRTYHPSPTVPQIACGTVLRRRRANRARVITLPRDSVEPRSSAGLRSAVGSRTIRRTKKNIDETRPTLGGVGSRDARLARRARQELAPFWRFPSFLTREPVTPFGRLCAPILPRRQTQRTRSNRAQRRCKRCVPEGQPLPRNREEAWRVPRLRHRSRSGVEARRGRCPVQHAVADERGGEGEGQVGVTVL